MSAPKDGGPAFACPIGFAKRHDGAEWLNEPQVGMSLRDWYKGQAIIGILQDKRYSDVGNEAACAHEIARYAGLIADELLTEGTK